MRIKLIKYITLKVERAKHVMIDPFSTLLTARSVDSLSDLRTM